MSKKKEITIDGTVYVPQGLIKPLVEPIDGMKYCMVRTYSAGVFCGWLKSRNGKEAEILEAIRIWKWAGAASLSQLAMEGTNDESNCKFGVPVNSVILTEVIEIIEMTEDAKESIQKVKSWKV